MSSNVDKEYYYIIKGRYIHLYKLRGGASGERITSNGVVKTVENELIYPNEAITDGLKIEYTTVSEPFSSTDPESGLAAVSAEASPTEATHVNVQNRLLALAVVDYVKAMLADKAGDIQKKEYYMKEFFSKLGDNESNRRNSSLVFPMQPFAIT